MRNSKKVTNTRGWGEERGGRTEGGENASAKQVKSVEHVVSSLSCASMTIDDALGWQFETNADDDDGK